MWTRIELKERAKTAFRKNYWMCVVVALILALITGSSGNSNGNDSNSHQSSSGYYEEGLLDDGFSVSLNESTLINAAIGAIFGAITLLAIVIALVLGIFVFNVIRVGGCRFFIENAYENPGPGKLLFAFKNGYYLKMVAAMFLMNLYLSLWTLLFIIPGIIKSYEYRMIPYLLADCPDMPREDAFAISKEMMYGNKWDAFVLDLSFLGWNILTALTCGLVGLFWAAPYQYATNAELFLALKEQYFSRRNTEQVIY